MTLADASIHTPQRNLSAGNLPGRQAVQGKIHFLIAFSITLAAFSLLTSGWAAMRDAIHRGVDSAGNPPEQIIQLAHMKNSSEMASPIAPLFTPEVQHWASDIKIWADEHNLDPDLVATVMQIESCGHPEIRSRAGAVGLFQVMPYHFPDGEDPESPDTNAARGLAYLKRSLELAEGNTGLALAGYNGGHGVIPLPESQWAEETIRYVYWGTGIYQDAKYNRSSSDRLDEWLQAGGASMCEQSNSFIGSESE